MRIGELLSTLIPPSLLAGCCGPNASNTAGSAADDSASASAFPDSADVTDVLDISPEGDAQAAESEQTEGEESTTESDSADPTGKPTTTDSPARVSNSDSTDEDSDSSDNHTEDESAEGGNVEGSTTSADQMTEDERALLQDLKTADRAVRAHEQAHLAAAGPYANGGASFQYRTGPDGRHYAVAGEVSIDASPESDPEATIRKAQVVRAAALAPADPSSQDRNVATQATKMEAQARAELRQINSGGCPASGESGSGESGSGESGTTPNTAGLARSFLASPGFTRLDARFDAVA